MLSVTLGSVAHGTLHNSHLFFHLKIRSTRTMVDPYFSFGKDTFSFCLENPLLLLVVGISKKDGMKEMESTM